MSDARHPPKNIVLLSDGTGNSAAKLMKTNVWRMYEAVDLTRGDQIACYDNGVGTSSFKPLAVLGGAIGWGLKRNVRHLYTYACSHYVAAGENRPADSLYGFGFSRGAFTMRVLMGLIESEGLITGVRGRELDRLAKWAYRNYRRKFTGTPLLVGPLRAARDAILRAWERLRRHKPYDQVTRVTPPVAFLGLWDTVDAYGLPIDEMTRGWNRWVWPLNMCERTRPANVAKVCHALALDDERHTFHPVLLDEREPDLVPVSERKPGDHTDNERVTQLWFAGVHSNVGGGYPDDSLAHVSLRWMAKEAVKKGLRLHSHVVDLWNARSDPHGPATDSRRGLGAYYRYNPRSVKKLTDDRFAEVLIKRPKVHETVFQRIAVGRDDYAPLVLPDKYDVVIGDGAIVNNHENPFEHATQATDRCAAQERVWNLVWYRRGLYFSTVGATVAILAIPFLFKDRILGDVDLRSGSLTAAIHLMGAFLPEMLQPITTYWEAHPLVFAVLVSAVAAMLVLSTYVQREIGDDMRRLWESIVRQEARQVVPRPAPTDLAYRIRSHHAYRNIVEFVSQKVFPFFFGVAALAGVVLVVAGTINRVTFALAGVAGLTCPAVDPPSASRAAWDNIPFDNKEICQPTGVLLERGRTYDISITLPPDWADASYPATLAGFGSSENPLIYYPALPFRRILREQWFVPIARIGRRSPDYYALTNPTTEVTPRRTAFLYLFVNDAVGVPPWRDYFYKNNRGAIARVTVTERTPAPLNARGR